MADLGSVFEDCISMTCVLVFGIFSWHSDWGNLISGIYGRIDGVK